MPEQDQHGVADHDDLVHQQHEQVAVDDHHDHHSADDGVDDPAQQVGVGDADQPDEGADEGVAADPHRDRVERDRGEQREERPDDPAPDPEVRAGADRVVGAGDRAEQAHRREDQRPDQHPDDRGGDRLPQRQPEQDREGSQDHRGEGVRATELDAEQVQRPRVPMLGRDRVDAVLLHLGGLGPADRGGLVRADVVLLAAHLVLVSARWCAGPRNARRKLHHMQ